MSHGRKIRTFVTLGVLIVSWAFSTNVTAGELPRSGDWRVFETSEECWTTTQVKGTSQRKTSGKVYVSARLAKGAREPEISLTIAGSFPTGLAIALWVDEKKIPLFIAPPQTAFPQDNKLAIQKLNTATMAVYVSGDKGYEIDLDGFSDALVKIRFACS